MHEKVNTIVYLRNRNKDEILTMGYQKKLKAINDHQKHAARNDFNQDKRTHSRPLLQSPNALYIAQFFPIIILVFLKKKYLNNTRYYISLRGPKLCNELQYTHKKQISPDNVFQKKFNQNYLMQILQVTFEI